MSKDIRLGPYRVLDELGSGGMGVVYRAFDDRLQREVALKVFALDGRAARRDGARLFEEARAASSLKHPNIVSVFDVGEELSTVGTDPIDERLVGWIAMERVEGKPLSTMLAGGRLAFRRALEILTPVADALASAHAAGIVHRDIKPANIVVTPEGRAIVLDFGLARRTDSEGPTTDERTLAPPTLDGMVVGTAAYMSPEQAGGERVDFRSDLFSFGATMYETLSGQRPFEGRSDIDVMHAIIHDEPVDLRSLVPELPEPLVWIVEKCLHKEPADRYQSTRDLVLDLKHALTLVTRSRPQPITTAERVRPPRRVLLGRATLLAVGGTALGVLLGWLAHRATPPFAPRIEPVADSTGADWAQGVPSPVGSNVVVTSNLRGNYDLYLLAPGADPVLRTDSSDDEIDPSWSPDGTSILYTRETQSGDEIWTIPSVGGAARRVLANACAASYTPDGKRLVFVRSLPSRKDAVGVADADGGNVRWLVEEKGMRLASPRVSPDGRIVAFVRIPLIQSEVNVYTVPIDGGPSRAITKEKNPFAHGVGTNACDFSRDGRFVYYSSTRGGTWNLWAVPVSGGAPHRLTTGVGPDVYPRTAPDGSVLFEVHRERWCIWGVKIGSDLLPLDAPHLLADDSGAWGPALSSDGTKLAYCTFPHQEVRSAWVVDVATRRRIKVSSGGQRNNNPSFSPDGSKVVWSGDAAGTYDLWTAASEGGPPIRLTDFPGAEIRPYFFPDGKSVVFGRDEAGKDRGVWTFDLATKKATAITPVGFREPRPSPDGKWVVCAGDREGGENHGIWILPADGSAPPRRVSERGYRPLFSPNGKEIVYLVTDPGVCDVWAVSVSGGEPRRILRIPTYRNYLQVDISRDGRLLAYNTIDAESSVWRWSPE